MATSQAYWKFIPQNYDSLPEWHLMCNGQYTFSGVHLDCDARGAIYEAYENNGPLGHFRSLVDAQRAVISSAVRTGGPL